MGISLSEKSSYLQWEFIWQNQRGEENPNNRIGNAKLHRLSYLDGLTEVYWSCLPSVWRHNPKETWLNFRGVCQLRCLPSPMGRTIFHLVLLLMDPLRTSCAEVWGFHVEIRNFKIHSNWLYKLTVVAMESQWRETLLTLLALLSCLFFCLIQVWLFPYPLMEGNAIKK